MILDGLHHITMITGHAQRTVDFYADRLGLRLVKKTVNFDAPDAYHLYFGDEHGSPGSILTWFEFAGAAPGRPGAGMIHTLSLGVATPAALDFWAGRLGGRTDAGTLRLADPDGLTLELVVADGADPRLAADHPEVPPEHAIVGLAGARAFAAPAGDDDVLLTETLGLCRVGEHDYRLDGAQRHFRWGYDEPPALRGRPGAGSTTSPGESRIRTTAAGASESSRRAPGSAPSTTATTSSRSTSANRGASSSRSPPARPASPSTRRRPSSARGCGCPASTSICAGHSNAGSRPS